MPSRCLSPPPATCGLPPHPSHLLLFAFLFLFSSFSLQDHSVVFACSGSSSSSSSSVLPVPSPSRQRRLVFRCGPPPWPDNCPSFGDLFCCSIDWLFCPLIIHPASFPIPVGPVLVLVLLPSFAFSPISTFDRSSLTCFPSHLASYF